VAVRVDALALRERHVALPCRITFPGNGPATHHGPFYGAPVVAGDEFTVLMSDGRTLKPLQPYFNYVAVSCSRGDCCTEKQFRPDGHTRREPKGQPEQ
jgi:hypothetical protein